MMHKTYQFYAANLDILTIAKDVEAQIPLKYVRYGHTTVLPPESFSSASEIPNLGTASHPSAVGCEKFVVCKSTTIVAPRPLKVITERDLENSTVVIGGHEIKMDKTQLRPIVGKKRYAIDQLVNPNSIAFMPGGAWGVDVLLYGSISTSSKSSESRDLIERFYRAIKTHFTKVKAFYLGPQAMEWLKSGKRLTISVQSPKEFDLTI